MRVFLDTNVVVDFCAVRKPFFHSAALIIDMANRGEIELIISALSFVNVTYVLRKTYPAVEVLSKLWQLMRLCNVSPINHEAVESALQSPGTDFEDTVQYHSALEMAAEIIITRDKTGFAHCGIPVNSPEEFVRLCMED